MEKGITEALAESFASEKLNARPKGFAARL
jgi:hypothetical protein